MSREMVDSGIEWIGKIPKEWEIRKINKIFFRRKEVNEEENPTILSLARDGVKVRDISTNEGQLAQSYDNYHRVYKNDLMLNPMDLISGANCSISEVEGVISPAYINLATKIKCIPKYYDYFFKNQYWVKAMFIHGKGVSFDNRWTLNYETIMDYKVPFPSIDEQQKIANYLDKKVKLINETIENNKKEIELLEEYKKSTINKSLNNVNFKKVRIKNTSYLKGRIGWQGLTTNDYREDGAYLITGTDFLDGEINWDSCVHISEERYEEDSNIHIEDGDLLITKDGTIGKLAIVNKTLGHTTLNSGVMLIRSNSNTYKYTNKYLYYVLKSDIFWNWYESNQKGNATIRHLYQEQFYNFEFPLPEINEQDKIVEYLDGVTKKLNRVIQYRLKIIEKLEEYKKSLIYEAVTGKIEV